MKRFAVIVEIEVFVTVDETKFDDAFMTEFRESFYQFQDLEDHVGHLAQIEARGLNSDNFIEGYGPIDEMGIKFGDGGWWVTDVDEVAS